MRKLFLILLFFISSLCFAQNVDSLKTILKTAGQTTARVDALSELSQFIASNNPDTALLLGKQALALAQKLNYKKGEAWAEYRIGRTFYFKQDFKEALFKYNNSLRLNQVLLISKNQNELYSAKKLMGKTLSNVGIIYGDQADYPKALEYYFRGLKLCEETEDKHQAIRTLNNIGNVYSAQADYPKALEYFIKGLKIAEEIGDKQQVSLAFGNIANVYNNQADYPKALEYYFKGLKIAEALGYRQMIERTLCNIAGAYFAQADNPKALEYYLKGLELSEEIGDNQTVGITLGNIGTLYTILGKYKEAEVHLKKALSISSEIGARDDEKFHHQNLSTLYEKAKRPALALEHYKKYIALRDTIFSQENTKKLMRSEMNFQYEKQQAVAEAKHKSDMEKQAALAKEKNRRQNLIIGAVAIGLLLVLVFAVFVFRSLRITRKQKALIDLKNIETEKQKHLIEEKQKEIIDSITYASRIQRALITSEKYIERNLNKLQKN